MFFKFDRGGVTIVRTMIAASKLVLSALLLVVAGSAANAADELDFHSFGMWNVDYSVTGAPTNVSADGNRIFAPIPDPRPLPGGATYRGTVRGTGIATNTLVGGGDVAVRQTLHADLTLHADFSEKSVNGTMSEFHISSVPLNPAIKAPEILVYDPSIHISLNGALNGFGFRGGVSGGLTGSAAGSGQFGGALLGGGSSAVGRWNFAGQMGTSEGHWRGTFKGGEVFPFPTASGAIR